MRGAAVEDSPMPERRPRYSDEEFARRGAEIYERDIRPLLSIADDGKYVSIDIESGAYEIDATELNAGKRLRARYPDAQIYTLRVGCAGVERLGFRADLGENR
jgi:hypothetical protein